MLSVKKTSSKWRVWTAVSATLLATLLTAFCALPAGAATSSSTATQTSRIDGHSCNPNPLKMVTQCTRTTNTGLKLKSMSGRAYNNTAHGLANLHIQLYWTNGKKTSTIHNCRPFNLPAFPGASQSCNWTNPHPDKRVRAGNYCSRTWQNNGHGRYSVLSSECVPVKR